MSDDDLPGVCDNCGSWSPCRTDVGGERLCERCWRDWFAGDDIDDHDEDLEDNDA